MKLRALAAASALAMLPVAASAVTVVEEDGTYDVLSDDFFTGVVMAEGGAGSYSVNFFSSFYPTNATADASVTTQVFGAFEDLTVSWVSDGSTVATTDFGVPLTTLGTTLTMDMPNQSLVFSWSDSAANAGFDFDVSGAAVPVPAAGLLFGTAAVAGGLARRRRKANA